MAQVPYTPYATVNPPGSPGQAAMTHLDVQPSMFGPNAVPAAQMEMQTAGINKQTGEKLENFGQQQLELYNVAQLQDTLANQYYPSEAKIMGDFRSKQGQDAVAAAAPTIAALQANAKRIASTLPMSTQRQFMEYTTRRMGMNMESISSHADQQGKLYREQSSEAFNTSITNDAWSHFDDPKYVDNAAAQVDNNTRNYFRSIGASDQVIDQKAKAAVSHVYAGVITQHLNNENAVEADKVYQSNLDRLTGSDQLSLMRQIHTKRDDLQNRGIVNSLITGVDNDANHYATTGQDISTNPLRGGEQMPNGSHQPMARGQLINNPTNIKVSKTSWEGASGSRDGFVSFNSPEDGIAAAATNLKKYQEQGVTTISQMISRWAPSNDGNNTSGYISYVSKETGINPNDPVDMKNPDVVAKLIKAMINVEIGGQPYSDQQIAAGLARAGIGNAPKTVPSSRVSIPKSEKYEQVYGSPDAPGFEENNIVTVTAPWKDANGNAVRVRLHKDVADQAAQGFNEVWKAANQDQSVIHKWGMDVSDGGYNNRNIKGTNTKSTHSWGMAMDFDAEHNPDDTTSPHSMPDVVMDIMERHGFMNLGRDTGRDYMHFQYVPDALKQGQQGGTQLASTTIPQPPARSIPGQEPIMGQRSDWVRTHYAEKIQQAYDEVYTRTGNVVQAERSQVQMRTKLDSIIAEDNMANQNDLRIVQRAIGGFMSNSGHRVTSEQDLYGLNPQVRDAWERLKYHSPQAADGILKGMIPAAQRDDQQRYGDGFSPLLARIANPDLHHPDHIWHESQLYEAMTKGDLTYAGYEQLQAQIKRMQQDTGIAKAESELANTVRKSVIGDKSFRIGAEDTVQEHNQIEALMAKVAARRKVAEDAKVSPVDYLVPSNKYYIGQDIQNTDPMKQIQQVIGGWTPNTVQHAESKGVPPPQPQFPPIKDPKAPTDDEATAIKDADTLRAMWKANKISKEAAMAIAIKRKWIKPPAQ